MANWPNPFIEQRADPFILRDGSDYYFIASVPEYDRLEIRRADSLEGLRAADPVVVWRKPESGPMSQLIWAPEMHRINGKWYIYFAATHTQALDKLGMFQHRMFATGAPMPTHSPASGRRKVKLKHRLIPSPSMPPLLSSGKAVVSVGTKAPDIAGNSNIYLAELENPWTIKGEPVRLSKPEYDWECRGFGLTKVRPSWCMATSCLSAIRPAPPMKTTVWDYCGLT